MNASVRTDRGSIGEFTALLDDSQGNRLAEFLLQKHGGPKRPRRIFEKCQSNRFSIDIRTEPVNREAGNGLQDHNHEQCDSHIQEGKDQLGDVSSKKFSKEIGSQNDQKQSNKIQNELCGIADPNKTLQRDASQRGQPFVENQDHDNLDDLEILLLETPTAADKLRNPLPQENRGEQSMHNEEMRAVEPIPSSPKSSCRHKNLVIPSSDRLRRNSLKRLSYITGRRTLLKEFENTVTDLNFMPFVCSTPLSPSIPQNQPNKTDATFVSIKTTQKDNEEVAHSLPKHDRESKISREICGEMTSNEGMYPLSKQDRESKKSEEICNEMSSRDKNIRSGEVVNESNGPRTFTIRKDLDCPTPIPSYSPTRQTHCSQELIFLPNRTAQSDNLKGQSNLPDIVTASPKVLKKSKESINRSKPSRIPRFTPNRPQLKMGSADSGMRSAKVSTTQNPIEIPQLQMASDKDDEIEIPETQQPQTVETSPGRFNEKQRNQEPVSIVTHHTFTFATMSQESRRLSRRGLNDHNKNEIHEKSSSESAANKTKEKPPKEKIRLLNRSPTKSPRIPDDDLRFCDILSDDAEREEESVAQRSSVPLNLAVNSTDYPQCNISSEGTRRLRRRSQRQLERNLRTQAKTAMGPPQAHVVTRRTSNRNHNRKIPMNAAPCTPINGEPFATEIKSHLARLNNREILDLRLRNSLGEVFPISGRRMSTSAAKQALEHKERLEKELQFEILKRNLNDELNKIAGNNEIESGNERQITEEFSHEIMPVPHDYRDEASRHQQTMPSESIPAGTMISPSNDNPIAANSKRESKSSFNDMTISTRSQRHKAQLNAEVDDENLFKIPPAPGFRDDVKTASVNSPAEARDPGTSLIHDSLLEQVTFRPTNLNNVTGQSNRSRRGRSTRSKKSLPDVLKKYMDIQNRLGQSKIRNTTTRVKRSLYSGDSDTSNESIRNACIDEGDKVSDKDVAAENPENNENIENVLAEALPVSVPATLAEPFPVLLIPAPALLEHSGSIPALPDPVLRLSSLVPEQQDPVPEQQDPVPAIPEPLPSSPAPVPAIPEPLPSSPAPVPGIPEPLPSLAVEEVQDNILPVLEMAGSSIEEKRVSGNFKKPQTPSQNKPKKKAASKKKTTTKLSNNPISMTSSSEGTTTSTNSSNQDNNETTTLRRSKRGPKPFKNYWSFRSTDPTPPYDVLVFYKQREEEKERRKRNKTNSSSTTASGQTTVLSSVSAISNSTNTDRAQNPRKRNPRKKNGSTDSNSLSSDSVATVTQPKRLSAIAEFEDNTKNTNGTNVISPTQIRQDLGNNRFNRLDEVDISFAATHKVSRTPLRSNQSREKGEQLPSQRNVRKKKRKEKASENGDGSAEAKSNQTQNRKGKSSEISSSKRSKRSRRKEAPSDEVEEITKNDVGNAPSPDFVNNIIVQSSTAAHINSILDQLAQASKQPTSDQDQNNNKTAGKSHGKKLRVRLSRMKSNEANNIKMSSERVRTTSAKTMSASPTSTATTYFSATTGTNRNELSEADIYNTNNHNNDNNNSNTASSINAEIDVPSWLKDISYVGSKILKEKEKKIFEDMHCSIPGNLVLTQVEGLDYAYYGNNKDIPFGYIRFKPKQVKPVKYARKFNLTFFVLSGLFRIGTNNDQADFGAGAVITIRIGSRYSIENLTDKMAILMVFKKR